MTSFWNNLTRNWQDSISLILGVWLFLSAWILGFAGIPAAYWNAMVFGVVIFAMTVFALMEWHEWEELADIAVGVWLVISPWVLGFVSFAQTAEGGAFAATWNTIAVGVLVIALAAWSVFDHRNRASGAH